MAIGMVSSWSALRLFTCSVVATWLCCCGSQVQGVDLSRSLCTWEQDAFDPISGTVLTIIRVVAGKDRCFIVFVPDAKESTRSEHREPLPVHIHFSGRHQSGGDCLLHAGLREAAFKHQFAVVCAEPTFVALQSQWEEWDVLQSIAVNDSAPQQCVLSESTEIRYFASILRFLQKQNHLFAVGVQDNRDYLKQEAGSLVQPMNLQYGPRGWIGTKVSISGFSQGSAVALYLAICFPEAIASITQVGTGVKIKGDGAILPLQEGSCEFCEYWPVKIFTKAQLGTSMRHCAFQFMRDPLVPFQVTRNICIEMGRGLHNSTTFAANGTQHRMPATFSNLILWCSQDILNVPKDAVTQYLSALPVPQRYPDCPQVVERPCRMYTVDSGCSK